MAPVVKALQADGRYEVKLCVTAQHRAMLDQVLKLFDLRPDHDLDLMKPGQDLTDITANVLLGLRPVLKSWRPDRVLVHGDTTTTLAASLAAYYERIPVGHVEAGLRTHDRYAPWPEELNRRLTGSLASIHFAPTVGAQANLLREGIASADIHVTGNTVIDALLDVVGRIDADASLRAQLDATLPTLDPQRRLILVTGHRRENFGQGFENICRALRDIATQQDVEVVYPVHLNPNVQEPVRRILVQGGRAYGVETADGTRYSAPLVISNAHVWTTLLDLVDEPHLAPAFVRRVRAIRVGNGFGLTVRCAAESARYICRVLHL